MAYTIAVGARSADIARFERRGVKVINLPGGRDKYDEILALTFKELREHMRDNVISLSAVTEERPLQQLLLPRSAPTRLCFFSLPLELLPLYKERVFPAVEDAGFVPITAEDVVTPGGTVNAKLDALIDRSSVMVVELGSSWATAEFNMAIARINGARVDPAQRKPLHLIVIVPMGEQTPLPTAGYQVLHRPSRISEDHDGFIADLAGTLKSIAADEGFERPIEPERLLNAGEYRAAVISAVTLLESTLRDRIKGNFWSQTRRSSALRSLVDAATDAGLIEPNERNELDSWMRTRNDVVHSSKSVSKAQATEIVNGVIAIVNRLQ